MGLLSNQKGGRLVYRFVDANGTINVGASNSTSDEVVTELYIREVAFNGEWIVKRGANTVMHLTGTGEFELASKGMAETESPTANIVVQAVGNGTIYIQCGKKSTYTQSTGNTGQP